MTAGTWRSLTTGEPPHLDAALKPSLYDIIDNPSTQAGRPKLTPSRRPFAVH